MAAPFDISFAKTLQPARLALLAVGAKA